jgi:hypothetical protein
VALDLTDAYDIMGKIILKEKI